ncbi:MAG: two-component system, response regulator YesN [Clostridiales bacterium]|nr:two-component system, response regulator YesN [Clostridiales bacterium]
MKKRLEDNRIRLRKRLFQEILFRGAVKKNEVCLAFVNEEYSYSFQEGCFQVICIKLDHAAKVYQSNTQVLEDKSVPLIMQELSSICYDLGVAYENGVIHCVLNYNEEELSTMKRKIKVILMDILLQDPIYQPLDVTIGMGSIEQDITGILHSFHNAEGAYQQRIINGTGKVFESVREYSSGLADSDLFQEFNRSFMYNINNLNIEQISYILEELKKNLLARTQTTGHEILQMTKEVCNLYLLYMRANNFLVEKADTFLHSFCEYADDCNSIHELFRYLNQTITNSIQGVMEEQKQEITKPIRLAKQYVEEHYMNSLTIDEVSLEVGFSPSHFSTMFKKEMGVTFLEFLSSIRMKHAKDLLKKGNKSIAVICEEVGYSDVKYFTKSFRKHTGLKPNEFRKLYS